MAKTVSGFGTETETNPMLAAFFVCASYQSSCPRSLTPVHAVCSAESACGSCSMPTSVPQCHVSQLFAAKRDRHGLAGQRADSVTPAFT